jgi:beta-xylosidase
VAAFTASGGGLAASASGSPFSLGSDVKVSGASTLTSCPFGASDDFADAYDNTEVEAQVAVNPTNAGWSKLTDVPWAACQGGPERFGRVTDPWVSYDKGGNAYFIGQPIDSAALGISAISVTTRNDSGWGESTILIEAPAPVASSTTRSR